ncbi:insoluble matrix shell protein 5-like isoform X2 [Ruditapes philippinarum]|uniref:insoluble matrix shell protein 5-like isoform X2 n=1 Tax=Ruditapes philippinarum TaxID=129788 RepID=UPI00295AE29C|nr:insoluble matrix shell protein 5-like isoform X2 [Ruditapes philippinarum]
MISIVLFGCLLIVPALGDQGLKAVDLFHQVDKNGDDRLTRVDLDAIFLLFDTNKDGKVTPDEFVADWQTFNLGNQQEAQTLFTRADTNDDGFIDSNDIPAIFAFFDQDGSGLVDISEFLTQWEALQTEPTNESNVSVDLTG